MSDGTLRVRTERQVWAAPGSSHDRIINGSRIVLPMLIGILSAFMIMAPLTTQGDVSFLLDKNKVEVARERLRTQSALYRGEDAKGRTFSLRAGSAVQKRSDEPVVELDQLRAQIQLKDGPAELRADHGQYDLNSEQVAIPGPLHFESSGGYDLATSNATVDLKTRSMKSAGAVSGTVPQGKFSASRMSADLDSHVVTLDGDARLRIVPGKTK